MQSKMFDIDALDVSDMEFGIERRPLWALALLGTVVASLSYGGIVAMVAQFV